jgi:hypothetical protein
MKTKVLLILMVLAGVTRAESLCDMQIVVQEFDARYGKPHHNPGEPCLEYNQPTFKVVALFGPPDELRPWATDVYFVSKRTAFTKAELQRISAIVSSLPGTYSKETSVGQVHFQLEFDMPPFTPFPLKRKATPNGQ